MNDVVDFFRGIFETRYWPPRWKCGYWSSFHGWLYIASDLMIALAYFLIPLFILHYFTKRKNAVKFQPAYLLFAAFILLCGTTHLIDMIMFYIPMYRLNAVVRFLTGVISLLTVYYLFRILPEAFRQKTNLELEKEIARRKEAEAQLEQANRNLKAFAYVASHDLQEPLRKMRTFAGMLKDRNEGNWDERSAALSEKIMYSAGRLQQLTSDVLNLSVLSESIPMGPVDVNQAIDLALNDLEYRIGEKNAEITTEKIPKVYGNLSYLSQLFLNLISNSIKFNEERPRIRINGERVGDQVIIRLSDNGIGISENDRDKVFEAFQRLHSVSMYEGSGIGLAICKRIVEIHEGSIRVESNRDRGSIFIVELKPA